MTGDHNASKKEYRNFINKNDTEYSISFNINTSKTTLERILKKISHYLSLERKYKVLDVGCGLGRFLEICEKRTQWELYGIDISTYAISRARKILKRAKFKVVDVESGLPFSDNYFDLITMIEVIEHLKSPFRVLKECYRVLKPEGLIVITTPNLPNLNALEKLWKKDKWYGFNDPTHLYLFTPDSLEFLVKRVGFKIESIETPFNSLPEILSIVMSKLFKKGGQILLIGRKSV